MIGPGHIKIKPGVFIREMGFKIGDQVVQIWKIMTVCARIIVVGLYNDNIPVFIRNDICIELTAVASCRCHFAAFDFVVVVYLLICGNVICVKF